MKKSFDYFRFIQTVSPWILLRSTINALLSTAVPLLVATLLGWLLNAVTQQTALRPLIIQLAVFILLIAIVTSLQLASAVSYEVATRDFENRINERTTAKLTDVSNETFNARDFRAQYAAASSGWMYTGSFHSYFNEILMNSLNLGVAVIAAAVVLGPIVTAKATQPWLTGWPFVLALVAITAVGIGFSYWLVLRSQRYQKQFYDVNIGVNDQMNYYLNDLTWPYENGKHLRIYDPEDRTVAHMRQAQEAANTKTAQVFFRMHAMMHAGDALLILLSGGFYLLIGIKALSGALPVGMVVLAVGYLTQLMRALAAFMSQRAFQKTTEQAMDDYIKFLNYPDQPATGSIPVEKRQDHKFEIVFHDVSFRYPGDKQDAVSHVSLRFKVGERLAIVGRNGSGKTTLIKLLLRILTPTSGKITLNGFDIQKYNLAEYQQLFATVFQDFQLFAFSVAENVAVSPQPDCDRVWQALTVAGVADRVKAMPKQIDTPLTRNLDSSGVDVSGGEAQKIAIARAWYKDAPFIILDEPTAALDPISEYEIYQHFDQLVEDKTAIYISHRMSATRFASQIAVMAAGQIVQMGSHEQLMMQDGLYRDLFNAQAAYYTEDKIKAERAKGEAAFNI